MSKGEVRLGCCPTGECFDHPALLAEIERLTADRERQRAALLDIGNLAATSVDDEFLRGVALRDIIYRCADAIDPDSW